MGGMMQPPVAPMGQPTDQLLGLDSLMGGGSLISVQRPQAVTPSQPLVGFGGPSQAPGGMGNMDFFNLQSGISGGPSGNFLVSPKTVSVCLCVCVVCVRVCVCVLCVCVCVVVYWV